MKDWVIIVLAIVAFMYISGSVSGAINALARAVGELAEKIDALNDKVESIVNDVADIEGIVSGRKEKFVNPFEL